MKNIVQLILIVLVLSCCNKNDDTSADPVDQLPPVTQTGEGTFGCLVNGVAFIEINTYFNCYYQFVNGQYYFSIGAVNDKNNLLRQIILGSNAAQIRNSSEYNLGCNESSMHYGEVAFKGLLLGEDTCNSSFGKLIITKLDFENSIVSGIFEFDIIHPKDKSIIRIRNGRFDTKFTR